MHKFENVLPAAENVSFVLVYDKSLGGTGVEVVYSGFTPDNMNMQTNFI